MSGWMQLSVDITLAMLSLAMVLCVVRLLRGPELEDRVLALDTLYIDALALLVVLGVRWEEPSFVEAALVIGMLGFVGTVALARYLLKGDIIE